MRLLSGVDGDGVLTLDDFPEDSVEIKKTTTIVNRVIEHVSDAAEEKSSAHARRVKEFTIRLQLHHEQPAASDTAAPTTRPRRTRTAAFDSPTSTTPSLGG